MPRNAFVDANAAFDHVTWGGSMSVIEYAGPAWRAGMTRLWTVCRIIAGLLFVLFMVPYCIGLNMCETALDAMWERLARREGA